ncbi:MAG: hypothetical protein WC979_02105 [Candidatus Pacearchaeota archaeon]|jgi:hypothetical protein|nr:hypothetical protein [Clostridia bacterium]
MITEDEYLKALQIVQSYKKQEAIKVDKKNPACRLERFPNNCCIVLHTSFKECKDCGHFIKNKYS